MSPEAEPVTLIKSKLDCLKVTSIAIVDDDFEPPHASAELDDLIRAVIISDESEVVEELVRQCEMNREELERTAHFEEWLVHRFWQLARGSDGRTAEVLRTEVFRSHFDSLGPLEVLRDTLKATGAAVSAFAPDGVDKLETAELWFFDLMWQRSNDRDIWKVSANKAREQYSAEKNSDAPPIFVLMSSDEDYLSRIEEEFRKEAMVPVGYFLTLPKSLLRGDNAGAALAAWLERAIEQKKLGFRRSVHALTRAIRNAADSALKKYDLALRNLAAEDYAHMYQNGVEHDGATLGSYMLWLFEPLFEHYIKEDHQVRRFQDELDRLTEADVPHFDLVEHQPSEALSEIFAARMWNRDFKTIQEGLSQGDLIREIEGSDDDQVLLVMNGDCDLVVSPGREMKRVSILLLRGHVSKSPQGKWTTDYFHLTEKAGVRTYSPRYISWELGNVLAVPYRQVRSNYQKLGWRLKPPYLTEIVQGWSQNATRIGTPVAPSPMERASNLSLARPLNGSWQAKTLDNEWTCLTFTRKTGNSERQRVLVISGADRLVEEISDWAGFERLSDGRLKNKSIRDAFKSFIARNEGGKLVVRDDGCCDVQGVFEIRLGKLDLTLGTNARVILWVQLEGM